MDTDTAQSAPARMVNLRQAAKLAKISEVTLRKHLKNGGLKGARVDGAYGKTWSIEYDALAAWVSERYGRRLSLRQVDRDTVLPPGIDSLRHLRDQLDAALVDVGRYKQLAAGNETTAAQVERILKEQIAQLIAERDAEKARADSLATRGWWRRHFGGN
jgi:hypothetical protein